MSQPPKATERIYLPTPSAAPFLLALGIAAIVVGIYSWFPYAVAGAIIALFGLVAWLRSNVREIARMPTRQHTDTAPIPLSGRE